MKLIVGNGTPIEGVALEVDGPVIKLYGKSKAKGGTGMRRPILYAYHLHPGESVRGTVVDGEEVYEVNQ